MHDEERDWEQDEEREAERMAKHFDLGWRFKTDRANVRHGETVDLGDDLAYREWLLRLRKVQVRMTLLACLLFRKSVLFGCFG